ncbi:MAG: YifB family Mg chelatase-like AAA ATPase [Acutalibacteraceae bacterium]
MVCFSNSMGIFGLETFNVRVEADVAMGFPGFDIVGLPDASVKESRDRVRSALRNCGFEIPDGKITINLAPAHIRKEGSVYDLPILMALLKYSGQLVADISNSVFIGELSLSGDVRSVNGVLPMTMKAKEEGFQNIYVPYHNKNEAAVVKGINVYPIKNLNQLFDHLCGRKPLETATVDIEDEENTVQIPDFSQVKGQSEAKRAIEIAAAGMHNILLIGTPGSGKSMLAKRIPSILPDMTFEESIETTKIHSVAGLLGANKGLITTRPFRAPHHTVSAVGLSGGGTVPKPGEVSLAHNGVLFLDELPEFSRAAMEVLRQPIENGEITISRVSGTLSYPCDVMLVAAMNPCPCGYYGHPTRKCICGPKAVTRYLSKVSGPLLDRIEIQIEVPPVEFSDLTSQIQEECSADIKKRVNKARYIQQERYKGTGVKCNSGITPAMLNKCCPMDDKAQQLLGKAFDKMGLSARAYDRILKVSRTIADLDQSEVIKSIHIAEAVQYRSLDRKYWTAKE